MSSIQYTPPGKTTLIGAQFSPMRHQNMLGGRVARRYSNSNFRHQLLSMTAAYSRDTGVKLLCRLTRFCTCCQFYTDVSRRVEIGGTLLLRIDNTITSMYSYRSLIKTGKRPMMTTTRRWRQRILGQVFVCVSGKCPDGAN